MISLLFEENKTNRKKMDIDRQNEMHAWSTVNNTHPSLKRRIQAACNSFFLVSQSSSITLFRKFDVFGGYSPAEISRNGNWKERKWIQLNSNGDAPQQGVRARAPRQSPAANCFRSRKLNKRPVRQANCCFIFHSIQFINNAILDIMAVYRAVRAMHENQSILTSCLPSMHTENENCSWHVTFQSTIGVEWI